MQSNEFLTPVLRIILCLIGLAIMGYYTYGAIITDQLFTTQGLLRAAVFLAFGYLLGASIMKLGSSRDDRKQP